MAAATLPVSTPKNATTLSLNQTMPPLCTSLKIMLPKNAANFSNQPIREQILPYNQQAGLTAPMPTEPTKAPD